jgi:hypothetical protein
MSRSVGGYISVSSRILDAQHNQVARLRPTNQYLHGIAFIKNLSLTPADLVVRNFISTQDQISYAGTETPGKWEFKACLFANHGLSEKYGLLQCTKRLSGCDEIATEVEVNGQYTENFATDIEIE